MDAQLTRQVTVWDGWIRLVHWSIVLLLGLSWWSIQTGYRRVIANSSERLPYIGLFAITLRG